MSPLTRYLSRLLGVTLLILAVTELAQPAVLTTIGPSILQQPGLLFVSGLLTLAPGVAIVVGHNVWNNAAAAIVSALGWLMAIKGSAVLLVPPSGWMALLEAMHYPSHAVIYSIVPVAAGVYLTYAGFFRRV